jgi:steroid delta-isomerase
MTDDVTAPPAASEAEAGRGDRAQLLRERVETYMARFSANDREGWLDLFADDAWIEDPVGTPRRNGRAEIGEFWDQSHEVPDAIELVPLGILTVAGDEVAFTMQARATLGGQVFGIDIIDVMRFDGDGRIATMRAFFDPTQMRPLEG